MEISELDFDYPAELVATEPLRPSRVLLSEPESRPREISVQQLLTRIPAGDVLVVNDTKVLPVRVWSLAGDEVLFVQRVTDFDWDVLFLARDYKIGNKIEFPDGFAGTLSAKGRPQRLRFEREISAGYFRQFGEPALPPYIQAARGERHARPEDHHWYQTAWAENPGSSAAPTASLHFSKSDLKHLEENDVQVASLTLHVGLGTFLSVKTANLQDHVMHSEPIFLPSRTAYTIHEARARGRKIWALGTTVTRALEAWSHGDLTEQTDGFSGSTDLFIRPGFEFQVVDCLLTNFHQPRSTLLSLVMAFAGRERVQNSYQFAIENKFRLFSYGDLTAWMK